MINNYSNEKMYSLYGIPNEFNKFSRFSECSFITTEAPNSFIVLNTALFHVLFSSFIFLLAKSSSLTNELFTNKGISDSTTIVSHVSTKCFLSLSTLDLKSGSINTSTLVPSNSLMYDFVLSTNDENIFSGNILVLPLASTHDNVPLGKHQIQRHNLHPYYII